MALDLTPEEKLMGRANFQEVSGDLTRRGFMKSLVVAGGAVAVAGAAGYFGYQNFEGKPIKAAIIGTGDEGGVLIGEHNPAYLEIVAICDIRPTSRNRAYEGDAGSSLRKGLKHHYGADCRNKIRQYSDYKEMLEKEKEIEAVVIATPLFTHAPITIDCLNAKKHVLCEKLMARTIGQCKAMIQAAADNDRILSIGHQRHYSMLYAHAVEVLNTGLLGDVKHIRALWHRNLSWPLVDDKGHQRVDPIIGKNWFRDGWTPAISGEDEKELHAKVKQYGYKSVEELVRWRLFNRTGGGLMAELGSHQLDACSIFLGKVHPLAVTGVGTRSLFGASVGDGKPNPREIDDHVFATYEFPGKNHPKGPNKGNDPDDVVVVTYSSISTNEFEPYGECIMGTRGSMIVETEQNVYLFAERDRTKKGGGPPKTIQASVSSVGAGQPVLDAGATWGGPAAAASKAGGTTAVSRGYREEMEDFAYCIKLWNQSGQKDRRLPRCHGTVAMADAIIALTSNIAMQQRQRIEFQDQWFDPKSKDVPDGHVKLETV
jgi:predicted dehydrogenase